MKINVTIAILALTAAISRADLFDTIDDLDTKYGSVQTVTQKNSREVRTYQSGDYLIEAYVERQKDPESQGIITCTRERITRVDGKKLTAAEINTLLTRKKQRGEWKYVGDDKWKLLNIGKAFYYPLTGTLVQYDEY